MVQHDKPSSTQTDDEARLETLTTLEELNTCSLVLSASGISHRIQITSQQHFEIYVAISELQEARDELNRYHEENRHWPLRPKADHFSPAFKAMVPIVIAGLMYIYGLSGEWSSKSPMFALGAGDSEKILQAGQYYRLVTALTMHADTVHLLSNCVLGGFLLHFLLLITGNGIGLFTVLASSTLANYINVILHGPGHRFVGFSTAVFVVIGMLCTINFARKSEHSYYRIGMSIMAGLALLAFLGSSGERTDLGGHLFGLVCGLCAGNIVLLRPFERWRSSALLQVGLGLGSFAIVLLCWQSAL